MTSCSPHKVNQQMQRILSAAEKVQRSAYHKAWLAENKDRESYKERKAEE